MSTSPPLVPVVCALIWQDGKVLLAQRPIGKTLERLWEFPGGKVDPGESPTQALHRELMEELGCEVIIHQALPAFPFHYPWVNIELHPFLCSLADPSRPPRALEHIEIRWLRWNDVPSFDLAPADLPVIAACNAANSFPANL